MTMRYVLPTILFLAPLDARADAPLGLRDAIRTALAKNYELAREAASVAEADAGVTVAEGAFDYRVGADASSTHYLTSFLGPQTDYAWDAYLGKRIFTGADVQMKFATNLTRTGSDFICQTPMDADDRCNLFTPSLTLVLTQPLLRGAWPGVVEAPVRKAEIGRTAAGWRRAARAADLLRDVIGAYWEVVYAAREIDIRQGALDLARAQLDITRAEIAAGRLASADSLAVELAIAQREAELIGAENALVERSLALRRLLGEPAGADVAPYRPADDPGAEPRASDPAARRAAAIERNPTLRAVRLDGRVREIDVEVARRGLLPSLGFTGSVGVSGQGDAYGGAIGNMFDADAHDADEAGVIWSGALSFVHYLGDRTARGADEIALLEARRAALGVADLEAEVASQSLRLALGLRAAGKLVEVNRVALRLARQNLDAEQARFSVGRVRNQDVLARQEELRQAQLRELRAAVDYLRIEAALDAVTGDLLEQHGVAAR